MSFSGHNKEKDIYSIVKEDVLRILGENHKECSFEIISSKVKVSDSLLSRTLKELSREGLVTIDDYIKLTQEGRVEAKEIVKKHRVLENYFKENRTKREAHRAAHILEHYVSTEVIKNLKKLSTLKEKSIILIELQSNKEALITDIILSDFRLFERTVSMGIFPGEKTIITNRIPQGLIIRLGNKKVAMDREIAKNIKVVERIGKS